MLTVDTTANSYQTAEYQPLARRKRPKKLGEVHGQDVIVTIIKNGLLSHKLGHGFLLSGIRGTGKTTVARLMAAALNCLHNNKTAAIHDSSSGSFSSSSGNSSIDSSGNSSSDNSLAAYEPCGECLSCSSLATDKNLDIIEIDAASNTGIDDIREVIESCLYRPMISKYKIFIIDEVHMLSKSAFNALLKTLEAPPAHVKFIFATTEVKKIPLTIVSRCLRLDFRRLDVDSLVTYLKQICTEEKVLYQDKAISILARAAQGSVRDGLSLLEQAMLLSVQEITTDNVQKMLNIQDDSLLIAVLAKILCRDSKAALTLMQNIIRDGADPLAIAEELTSIVHDMTVVQVLGKEIVNNIDRSDESLARLAQLAQSTTLAHCGALWQMLLRVNDEIAKSAFPIQTLEIGCVKLCFAVDLPSLDDLVAMAGVQSGAQTGAHREGGNQQLQATKQPDGSRMTAYNSCVVAERAKCAMEDTVKYKADSIGDSVADVAADVAGEDKAQHRSNTPEEPLIEPVTDAAESTKEPAKSMADAARAAMTEAVKNVHNATDERLTKDRAKYNVNSLDDLLTALLDKKQVLLYAALLHDMTVISLSPGYLQLQIKHQEPKEQQQDEGNKGDQQDKGQQENKGHKRHKPPDMSSVIRSLNEFLNKITDSRWCVDIAESDKVCENGNVIEHVKASDFVRTAEQIFADFTVTKIQPVAS